MFSADDHRFMELAIKLARKGLCTTDPNPRVGCVIVKDGNVVGQGFHVRAGEPHAEVHALSAAGSASLGATAYVTLEPCSHQGRTPPCAGALVAAGVERVVVAMQDPNPLVAGRGIEELRQAGVEVQSGLLEVQSRQLNPGFIKRMEQGLPYVRVKLAMSLDGRTAMASGESVWITSPQSREDVQRLRARASAVLTGSGTVVFDDPSLNVRLADSGQDTVRQPLRVILDSNLKTPASSKTLSLPGRVLILHASTDAAKIDSLTEQGADLEYCSNPEGRVDLQGALGKLAEEGVNEVHVEAGATLCGALMAEGLVDECVIYMAPHLMGDQGRGLFSIPGLDQMADRINMQISDIRAVGSDWRITANPEIKES